MMQNNSNIFQFIFISTGWLVSHEIWRLFNPETDTEVNVESLVNFVVTDQNGLGGASIGIGYVSYTVTSYKYPSLTSHNSVKMAFYFQGGGWIFCLDLVESTCQPCLPLGESDKK